MGVDINGHWGANHREARRCQLPKRRRVAPISKLMIRLGGTAGRIALAGPPCALGAAKKLTGAKVGSFGLGSVALRNSVEAHPPIKLGVLSDRVICAA